MSVRAVLLLVPAFYLGFAPPALAIGAQVDVTHISPCPSFCGGPGGSTAEATHGGEGFSRASLFRSILGRGSGRGVASLAEGLGAVSLPSDDTRVIVEATLATGYIYTGAGLGGQLSLTLEGTTSGEATVEAVIAMILVDDFDVLSFSTDSGTLLNETIPDTPGASVLDMEELELAPDTAAQSIGAALVSGPLAIGSNILIYAQLRTVATRGGVADAFDTLTWSFDEPDDFQSVPEPTPTLLGSLGVLLFAAVRRSRVAANR